MSSRKTCKLFIYSLVLLASEISGKIYERCELANELRYRHYLPIDQVAAWTCIAQYQSNFNTATVNYQTDGSGYHGMYQISDMYWCSPPNVGLVCNVECYRLEDDDLTDDLSCMQKIFDEHQRISGDGFNAWTTYPQYCSQGRAQQYVSDCFANEIANNFVTPTPDYYQHPAVIQPSYEQNYYKTAVVDTGKGRGKVYERCELAIDLRYKYNIPKEQIATWICIAKHESNFNTSAIGRLNADGSEDHGLFQISDIYWCSPPGKGWACGLSCSQLEDNDISDDVECMKKIHAEHTRISGDGFTAWTVYTPYCQGRSEEWVAGCFPADEENAINYYPRPAITAPPQNQYTAQQPKTGYDNRPKAPPKIYERCELAKELLNVHNMPRDQISMWVCIVHHESNFNTSAVGRLNADGSEDHGLFQISDLYWCSPPGKGYSCGVTCAQLEDNDITDDIACVKKIHDEHTRISGDGFTAWTVYNLHCKGRDQKYTDGCFADENPPIPRPAITSPPHTTTKPPAPKYNFNSIYSSTGKPPSTSKNYYNYNKYENTAKPTTKTTPKPFFTSTYNHFYQTKTSTLKTNNSFLNYYTNTIPKTSYSTTTTPNPFAHNPFFNFNKKTTTTTVKPTYSSSNNLISSPSNNPFAHNPFLSNYYNQQSSGHYYPQYTQPQISNTYSSSPVQQYTSQTQPQVSNTYSSSPVQQYTTHTQPQTSNTYSSSPVQQYRGQTHPQPANTYSSSPVQQYTTQTQPQVANTYSSSPVQQYTTQTQTQTSNTYSSSPVQQQVSTSPYYQQPATNYQQHYHTTYTQPHQPQTTYSQYQDQTIYSQPPQITHYQQPITSYYTHPQNLVTVKPFSFDYISKITTPKPFVSYSPYYPSASIRTEVTTKFDSKTNATTLPVKSTSTNSFQSLSPTKKSTPFPSYSPFSLSTRSTTPRTTTTSTRRTTTTTTRRTIIPTTTTTTRKPTTTTTTRKPTTTRTTTTRKPTTTTTTRRTIPTTTQRTTTTPRPTTTTRRSNAFWNKSSTKYSSSSSTPSSSFFSRSTPQQTPVRPTRTSFYSTTSRPTTTTRKTTTRLSPSSSSLIHNSSSSSSTILSAAQKFDLWFNQLKHE